MRYLLDTNVVSALVRDPGGHVSERVGRVGEQSVCTSIIVAAEIRYGAEKRGSARLAAQVEKVLDALEVIPFEQPADAAYGALRARLERDGQVFGGNDLLIASQALVLGYTLVTGNVREFARIKDLPIENWLR